MTSSQISLPVPVPPVPGTGRPNTRADVSRPGAQEVSGLRLGEGTGPLTFTVEGMRPVGQGAISHGQTGMAYHTNGKILKPWRALVQAAAVDVTGRHAYVAPKPIKAPKGQKKPPRPAPICVTCGTPRNRHGLYLGAVGMYAVVTFAKPKSAPDRRFASVGGLGDWDHHGRAIGDALTGVIWADDAQVVDGRTVKTYIGEHPDALGVPGAAVWIWELTP